MVASALPSSYRDPSGFVFEKNGRVYRQVNESYKEHFDLFLKSGLYQQLVAGNKILPHEAIAENLTGQSAWYLTLEPEQLEFVSSPSEWSFDMLKDAALLTLDIAKESLQHGMMLKDASVYNVQWHKGKMIFIDTLSFERYEDGKPWIAYRQFCEHFYAPLAAMHFLKQPLNSLFITHTDGFPLSFVKSILPFSSRLHLHTSLHVHLHAGMSKKKDTGEARPLSIQKLQNLLRSLEEGIGSFSLSAPSGVWSDYYEEAFGREDYLRPKQELVADWLQQLTYHTAVDLGANEGLFSLLAAKKAGRVIAVDEDHYSINRLYQSLKENRTVNVYPVVANLAFPTPATGWNNGERSSLLSRLPSDLVLALAILHHLAIGRNIPFHLIAPMFRKLGKQLIVEFVPKEDPMIRKMLQRKKDVYTDYSEENFLFVFSKYFTVVNRQEAGSSKRVLYLKRGHDQ